MASTITTSDFTITTSGYQSGSTHYFYAGQHNYLKATRLGSSSATSLYLKIGTLEEITYNLKADGSAEIDITSLIRAIEGTSSTMLLEVGGTGIGIAVYHGMSPDDYKALLVTNLTKCEAFSGDLGKLGILPDTIFKASVAQALPCAYDFSGYSVFTSMNISNNLVTISAYAGLIKAKSSTGGYEWSRRLVPSSDYPLVKVELTSALGKPAAGTPYTGNDAVFYLEQIGSKINATITDLQTIGDGYKAISEIKQEITIGLHSCSAYDYAYYMLMMLTAEDILIDGEPCEISTNSATLLAGDATRKELEITLKRKNYVTI